MNETASASRVVTYDQVKTIIDFMGQHVEFAAGSVRTLEARHESKRLWGELSNMLNSCRGGTWKTSDGWSKYWSDFKNKLKNKAKILKRKKGSAKKGIKPLTALERRALVILGPHFEKKLTRTKAHNGGSNHQPPEVKLEAYQDNSTNDFYKTKNDIGDGTSPGDKESEESSVSSDEEYVEDTDQNSNEPLIHSLYPKWLIEVEKKRADAELLRAKAEEQRAEVAAKSAEAAHLQAEALRKLSEAAVTQADALVRIAMVLESRGHRDIMSI